MIFQAVLTALASATSIAAALIAARSARAVKRHEIDAQRARDLESRISEKKYDTYKPMINLMRDVLDRRQVDEDELRSRISDFATWVSIYGSDEAVKSFHYFMQATFNSAPPVILLKLYYGFVLAARRDIGFSDTKISEFDFLGIRITDAYTDPSIRSVDRPLAELCAEHGWSAPWLMPQSRHA